MALWCRLKQSQLKNLSNQFKRCYFQLHAPFLVTTHSRISGLTKQDSVFQNTQFQFCKNVRSFAVPAQFKPKQEEEEDDGPRMNEKITAQYIRLVLDEGHNIMSRHEALERAKSLKLDLVEVDRNAKPPVCKIMDYHREQYTKRLKEKERAKSKSEVTLRKGASKSVQFEGKIEEKDLQMKAATVKRMMESGYRVKCLAKVNDKKAMANEDENLPGLLARFCALIEDVAVIESGPLMEKKGAFVVVRHVKYGLPKKGAKKTSLPKATSNHVEEDSDSEAGINSADESPLLDDPTPTSHPPEAALEIENRYKKDPRSRSPPSTEMNSASPPLETANRYKKDPRNRSSPTEMNFPSADPRSTQPQYPYQGRQPQQYPNQGRQPQQYPNQGRQPQQYPDQGRQPQQYPNQGRQPQQYPVQGRQPQQYPNQGRQPQQYPNQGRPTQQYPNQGRQAQQYPNQGIPVQVDPSTSPQSREVRQGQFNRNSRFPAEEFPRQEVSYPGVSPNSSGQRHGVFNGHEPDSIPEPQPTEVNRYKKAVNQNSRVSNLHGSRGQGR